MFEHDCLDTCCFECLICICFGFFLFAPVQRNLACFTWEGALKIRSFCGQVVGLQRCLGLRNSTRIRGTLDYLSIILCEEEESFYCPA